MKKVNPLFVDSSKLNGESIATQVELKEIPEYVGEMVYVKVFDKEGMDQVFPLERKDPWTVSGYVFLRHQQEVTYQFFVARHGRPLFMTPKKTSKASYFIEEKWEPVMADEELKSLFEAVSEDVKEVEISRGQNAEGQ